MVAERFTFSLSDGGDLEVLNTANSVNLVNVISTINGSQLSAVTGFANTTFKTNV